MVTKTTKRETKISLKEFKAWLQGVEELQPKDWHPDLAQWRLIRKKINSIEVPEYPSNAPGSVQNFRPAQTTLPGSSLLPPPAPPVPSAGIPSAFTETQQRILGPTTPAAQKSITPNIDTTNGKYESTFV